MAESGASTAAQEREGQSPNGGDPGHSPEGGTRQPSLLRRFMNEVQSRLTADLDDRDPDFIRENLSLSWLIASIWFRGEVRDMERIPEEGPVLLVGNHSGGNITPDTIVFSVAFNTYFGVERPFYQLAHNLVLTSPVGPYLRKFGAVAASHENARRALDSDAAVLVYPGGDWETFRPSWHTDRIEFADRRCRPAGMPPPSRDVHAGQRLGSDPVDLGRGRLLPIRPRRDADHRRGRGWIG